MIWPVTAERVGDGSLWIGGVALREIARDFATPVYVYDVATIRSQCRLFTSALSAAHERPRVAYAAKAWLNRGLLELIAAEGLSLDVVSAGELYVALQSGFPAEKIAFHGNNKGVDELRMALDAGIGAIVIDNFDEIEILRELVEHAPEPINVLLRLNPGVDVHTHDYRKTGIVDSKFGLGIATGDAALAVERILDIASLHLRGFHAHIGSQIFEVEPFIQTVDIMFEFASVMRIRHGYVPEEISPGGGIAIDYTSDDPDADGGGYATAVGRAAMLAAERHDMPTPTLTIEPGRSIVGRAGVAVYTLGARKEIPGIRTYVSVDGGIADNIRPPLYGARYTAELVDRPTPADSPTVTIAGKFCESGDVLIDRVSLPEFAYGDLLAVPAAGAYCLAMASNYNLSLRPAVVFVEDGKVQLIQRRERFEDLLTRDIPPGRENRTSASFARPIES